MCVGSWVPSQRLQGVPTLATGLVNSTSNMFRPRIGFVNLFWVFLPSGQVFLTIDLPEVSILMLSFAHLLFAAVYT